MEEKSLRQKVIDYTYSERFARYKRTWLESCHHFFEDGYLFWLNENWIETRLQECDYVRLYQFIIRKLETEIKTNKKLNKEDKKYLKQRLVVNQHAFYKELSGMIQDYCIG